MGPPESREVVVAARLLRGEAGFELLKRPRIVLHTPDYYLWGLLESREYPLSAQELLPQLQDEYQKTYYAGIIYERRGRAHLKQGSEGSGYVAYDWLQRAMDWYEKSEELRPSCNADAVLRWNACARTIMEHDLEPAAEDTSPSFLE